VQLPPVTLPVGSLLPSPAHVLELPPDLVRALGVKKLSIRRIKGEDPERYARRIETHLMVLFRETGSEKAFEALYRITSRAMGTWVLHLIGRRPCPADPLERVQDTFLNIHRYGHSFRDGSGNTFRSWARTIAANVLRRALRKAARGVVYLDPATLPVVESLDPGPCDRAVQKEEERKLSEAYVLMLAHYYEAWTALALRDRHALELIEVEGLKQAQAAERMGIGKSAIKMVVFRARARVRAGMAKAMGADLGAAAANSRVAS